MKRFRDALRNPQKALKQIGAMMVAESEEAFEEQAFGEADWDERGLPNVFGILQDLEDGGEPKDRRFETTPVLIDAGHLSRSITFETGKDSVTVGSNLEYAALMHGGGTSFSVEITEDIQARMRAWLDGPGKQWEPELGFITRPAFLGQKLEMEVPARPFVGVTKQTIEDVAFILGVEVFEVNRA